MVTSFPKKKIKILLLENIHPVAKSHLEKDGFDVEEMSGALSDKDIAKAIKNVHIVGIRSKTQLRSNVLEEADKLLSIGAFCIGTNQIDLEFANTKGVPVFNAPYSNTRSVAELIIAEIISLSRKLGDRSALAHRGQWDKSATGSREVRGKTLGIVGYGHIGSQVSVLAEALGLNVKYFDIVKKLPLGNSLKVDSLSELLSLSDFVSVHVPETPETQGMFDAKMFSQMKKGAYFLNASRGTVAIIEDLKKALETGQIAGAAVDVFPEEPKNNSEPFQSPLQGLENVILTPHIGGSTEEAQESIGIEVSDSLLKFINNGSTTGAVNFPNVDLPVHQECHRVLNVHRNVPGVLGKINKIVSDHGANIRAQYLSTDPNIGYLVMDMEKAEAESVNTDIRSLETSIRTRILY